MCVFICYHLFILLINTTKIIVIGLIDLSISLSQPFCSLFCE